MNKLYIPLFITIFSVSLFAQVKENSSTKTKEEPTTETNIESTQEDLLSLLGDDESKNQINYAAASFKTTRIINGHSLETTLRGVLDARINHRFGFINKGIEDLFGLDDAFIRIGADYGITDRLTVGLGRNSVEKVLDGFIKYKILHQSTGKVNMPITLVVVSNIDLITSTKFNPELSDYFWTRSFYTNQLLIGRKISEGTSIQFMPTLVHRNYVKTNTESNDVFLIGVAGRQKLTKRLSLNAEYYYALPNQLAPNIRNSLSIGLDIETGGHVFQLFFSNSKGTDHRSFLTDTTNSWSNREIGFGFNVSRVFTLVKPKELRKN
ncbi:MAG: DUF5777 family beta-barrel protein [Solirubrobacteraceae bacterium]